MVEDETILTLPKVGQLIVMKIAVSAENWRAEGIQRIFMRIILLRMLMDVQGLLE